jgi:hypothetical protein
VTVTQTAKKAAQEILDRLPEDADWDRIMYELHVKQKIEHGMQAMKDGRVVSQDEARRRLLGDES